MSLHTSIPHQFTTFTFQNLPQFPSFPSQLSPYLSSPSSSYKSNYLPTPSPTNSTYITSYKASIDSIEVLSSDLSLASPSSLHQKSESLNQSSKKISKKAKGAKVTPIQTEISSPSKTEGSPKKRNPWSVSEDAELIRLINIHGKVWAKVASLMGGRTGKQVRDRYLNVLAADIRKGPWTDVEDKKIWQLFKEIGPHWCKIAAHMEGRTEIQVKNRYYTHLKRINEEKGEVENCFSIASRSVSTHSTMTMASQTEQDPTDMISYANDNKDHDDFWRNGNFDFLNF